MGQTNKVPKIELNPIKAEQLLPPSGLFETKKSFLHFGFLKITEESLKVFIVGWI